MSPAPKKRNAILIAVGAGVFVVGTGLAAFAVNDGDGGSSAPPAVVTTTTVGAGAVSTAPGVVDFVIPSGMQAISVQVGSVPGVTTYPKAGSYVNVYGAYSSLPIDAQPADPKGKLVLQKIKVLAAVPSADGANTVYTLAVNTHDAETLVYLTSFQKVYLTLARDDQGTQTPSGFSDDNA